MGGRLAAAMAVFIILGGLPWVLPIDESAPTSGRQPGQGAEGAALPVLPPFEELAESLRRPLFVAARRAAPAPSQAGQVAPDGATIGRYRLTGAVTSGDRRFVMLREGYTGRVLRVPEGSDIEGWTVKSIAQDRILLGSAAGEHSVVLGPSRAPPR